MLSKAVSLLPGLLRPLPSRSPRHQDPTSHIPSLSFRHSPGSWSLGRAATSLTWDPGHWTTQIPQSPFTGTFVPHGKQALGFERSLMIPYLTNVCFEGSVIFACHKIKVPSRHTASTMPQAHNASTYRPQQPQCFQQQIDFPLPPLTSQTGYVQQTQSLPASYSTQRRSGNVAGPQGAHCQWESSAHVPLHVPTVGNLQFGAYAPYLHPR